MGVEPARPQKLTTDVLPASVVSDRITGFRTAPQGGASGSR
ncbi:hypothetical protein YT1_2181 [Rhodococcus ruber]|nr:hypothetical protein YT1_2181 [Rhodococcus ruber]